MQSNSGVTEKGIERILELSADAHIQRRQAGKDTPAYQRLSGMIAAYGKALGLLTALHQREEFFFIVSHGELPESLPVVS